MKRSIAPDKTAGHSDAVREAVGSEEGWKATVAAGKIVGLEAYGMLQNPAKVKEIQESFKEAKERREVTNWEHVDRASPSDTI